MTSMFHWLDVNRRRCATSRQRRFNCATSFDATSCRTVTDFYKVSSLQKLWKRKKEKKRRKEPSIALCSHRMLLLRLARQFTAERREEEKKKKKKEERKIKREGPSEERRLKDGRLFRATRKLKSPPCRFLGDEMNFITDILQTGSPEKGTTKLKGINFFGCNWLPFSFSLSRTHVHVLSLFLFTNGIRVW